MVKLHSKILCHFLISSDHCIKSTETIEREHFTLSSVNVREKQLWNFFKMWSNIIPLVTALTPGLVQHCLEQTHSSSLCLLVDWSYSEKLPCNTSSVVHTNKSTENHVCIITTLSSIKENRSV